MMDEIKIINIEETDSTNNYLRSYQGEEGSLMTIVCSDYQSKGRGQGVNRWESERGQNLTFSIMIHPIDVKASLQYVLLEAQALAIADTLSSLVDNISIKWPNDIYYKNKKICGTLSECTLNANTIKTCIIGTGININQQLFVSDAPNPISLFNILGYKIDRNTILIPLLNRFKYYLEMINSGLLDDVHRLYKQLLYRKQGYHIFEDANGRFKASIKDVKQNGHLVLEREDNTSSVYAFKEVKFIIDEQTPSPNNL